MRPVKLSQEQLEWIVSEVVRRLRALAVEETANAPAAAGTLALEDRLVTLATLEGKLDRVSRLEVRPKTIVTPAVVDLLKERRVQLVRVGGTSA